MLGFALQHSARRFSGSVVSALHSFSASGSAGALASIG